MLYFLSFSMSASYKTLMEGVGVQMHPQPTADTCYRLRQGGGGVITK